MIRTFEKGDLSPVMQLWLETNLQAHGFIPAAYWEENFPFVQEALPQAEVYVYETEGKIKGFLGITGEYIAGIFVDRTAQSGGIGKQLLDHAKQCKTHLTLQVYQKNKRAVAFYRREGFLIQQEAVEENTGEKEFLMAWKRP